MMVIIITATAMPEERGGADMAKEKKNAQVQAALGRDMSFGAAEAYKRLRTNLDFSMPDLGDSCKVIGITSSQKGEGKSTTAVNLAYTIAQTGKNVLLIECDLRLPTYSKRLRLAPAPGFTNLLVGTADGSQVLQKFNGMSTLRIITAGDIPPNPAELLSSKRMRLAIEAMKQAADVIILDLPPVCEVSDALIVSYLMDGIIVAVRENYCDKRSLEETMRQLRFAEVKVLGFVLTDSRIQHKKYKKGYGYEKKNSAAMEMP